MCRSERDPDGPRRCPGDARAAYHRTAVAVLDLEHAEAELMQELAAIDTGAGGSSGGVSRPVVSFPDKGRAPRTFGGRSTRRSTS